MTVPDDIDAWFDAQEEMRGDVLDAEGNSWDSWFTRFWRHELGVCDCVSDDTRRVMARVVWALWSEEATSRGDERSSASKIYCAKYGDGAWYEPAPQMALCLLESRDLIDHGISIRCAFLSPKGIEAVGAMFDERQPEGTTPHA